MYATIDVERPVFEVVAAAANAEDLFEEAGIDYWFGWNRPLRAACEAAHVDPEKIAFRLLARDDDVADLGHETLVTLFSALDQHFEVRLEPALLRARRAAETLDEIGERHQAAAVLDVIEQISRSHVQTVRRILGPVAAALDIGASVTLDRPLLRHLALEHSTLAMRANDLRAQAERVEGTDFAHAARVLIREIHQHIKISYNFVFPRLTSAIRRPARGYEPW